MVNIDWYLKIYNLSGKNSILDQIMILGAVYLIFITVILAVILGIYFRGQELKAIIVTMLAVPIAYVTIILIRLYYIEPRPFVSLLTKPLIKAAIDPSYPSEHTTLMSIIFFSFIFCGSRFWPVFLICLLWVGFARIYTGVHYPLDIIAGICVGFIASHISKLILIWTKKKLL